MKLCTPAGRIILRKGWKHITVERCQVYEEPPPGGAGVFWGVWHEAGSDEKGVCD